MDKLKIIDLKKVGDSRGKMAVLEGLKEIPFQIKRIFYIWGSSSEVVRGNHANRNSRFVFISLAGECKIKIFDGRYEFSIVLDNPEKALYMDKMVWKTMQEFSEDNILLVISDCDYDVGEYIYNIDEFKREVFQHENTF